MRPHLLWDLPAACALLTRLPLPRLPEHAFQSPARATWAYPVVGLLLGVIAALIWSLLASWPPMIRAGLTLAGLILMTGALHEDGLADTADGFWGAQTVARRLEIMKDSHIGTYGVLALILIVGLRWLSLSEQSNPASLVYAVTLSRGVLPILTTLCTQARSNGLAASVGPAPYASSLASLAIALLVGLLILPTALMLIATFVALATAAIIALVAHRKIGGITGDVLGTTQQLCELSILLALL